MRGVARELVPRTHQLTVIAAIDAIAERRAQRLGDRTLEFDRQVGDAAACIELIGRDDRAGRAGGDAGASSCRNARSRGYRSAAADRCRSRRERTRSPRRARLDWCACRSSPARHCEPAPSPAPARCRRIPDSRGDRRVRRRRRASVRSALAHHLVVVAAQRIARDDSRVRSSRQHLLRGARRAGPVIHARARSRAACRAAARRDGCA